MKNDQTLSFANHVQKTGSCRRNNLLPLLMLPLLFLFSCQKKDFSDPLKANEGAASGAKSASLSLPSREEAGLAMQVFNKYFYRTYGTQGTSLKSFYYNHQDRRERMYFWMQAESIETLIDAYLINPGDEYKEKITYLFNGLIDNWGTNWRLVQYNDDIIWGVIMSLRAYLITKDQRMLNVAKENFNLVWNRAWDDELGGGLWWEMVNKYSKNSCVNAPAALAAMFLTEITNEDQYLEKAKLLIDWMVFALVDQETGEVHDAVQYDGTVTGGPTTYNQGTFIGACGELDGYYHSDNYYRVLAKKALDYTKNVMSDPSGLLPHEHNGNNPDSPGFKGIFARWACKFIRDYNLQAEYTSWIDFNATQAWAHRNSKGLMWHFWDIRTPDTNRPAWPATSGISMMNAAWLLHP